MTERPKTIIANMNMTVPKGGTVPKFGEVHIINSLLRSQEETLEFDASGTLFELCLFDGLIPKNSKGCNDCKSTGWCLESK